jgi:hypothetical protein
MRLHQALELIQAGHFIGLKNWQPGEADKIKSEVFPLAAGAAEFTLLFETDAGTTLNTFQQFGFDLLMSRLAEPPYENFWLSWREFAQGPEHPPISLGAFCKKIKSADGSGQEGIGIYTMAFGPRQKTGHKTDKLIFCSKFVTFWYGEANIRIPATENTPTYMESTRSAVRAVAALIGALGTPKSWRVEQLAPEKLNRQRRLKGKPEIRSQIIIDLSTNKNTEVGEKGVSGGWFVRPHWRRGHIRTLADGRRIPIPPCCVNMEENVPVKPEYILNNNRDSLDLSDDKSRRAR